MKTVIICLCLAGFIICSATAQIRVQARLTTHTDSSTTALMGDSLYLQNLSGDYLINNSGPEVAVLKTGPAQKLRINLPGQGEYELRPLTPELFDIEGLQKVRILFFLDRFGQSRAINIIDEKEGMGSIKRQIGATKKGIFKE